MDNKSIASAVKVAMKSGKVVFGERTSLRTLKSSKLVVASSSLPLDELQKASEACKEADVPLLLFEGSAVELGAAAGRPFSVKVLSIKSAGDADLSKLLRADKVEAAVKQKA